MNDYNPISFGHQWEPATGKLHALFTAITQKCNINKLIKRLSGNTFASIVETLLLVIQGSMVGGGNIRIELQPRKSRINREHQSHYTYSFISVYKVVIGQRRVCGLS